MSKLKGVTKLAVVVSTFVMMSSQQTLAAWIPLAKNSDGAGYINSNSVFRQGDAVWFTMHLQYPSPLSNGAISGNFDMLMNCQTGEYLIHNISHINSRGKVIGKYTYSDNEIEVNFSEPGSIGDSTYNILCH